MAVPGAYGVEGVPHPGRLALSRGHLAAPGGGMVDTPWTGNAAGGTHATSMYYCYSQCVGKGVVHLEYRGVGIMASCPWCTLCFQGCSFPHSLSLGECVFTGCNEVVAKAIF